jgi:hypothetical protein
MSRQLLSRATDLFLGAVAYARAFSGKYGAPFSPLVVHNFGAPIIGDADGISVSATITAPASAVIGGALASGGVATFDVPRNVVGAWTNTATVTIVGTDVYGSLMTEVSASGTSHTGTKAFKTVTSVTPSVTVTGATFGTGDVLGLPYRVDKNKLIAARAGNAIDAGVFVPAVTTDPATGTTGDVRGTFNPAVTLDGVETISVVFEIADRSSKVGTYGVKQFGSADSV